ncbi:MAG TPA: ABC transporter substrate-binding protein, partial [Flavobacteriales bacterium]|nr:ABC transporter substrate-binding protein [Flavobacteriales bacterium]
MKYPAYILLLIILFCISCAENPDKNIADTRTVFRYNESAGISSLDPSFARNVENIWAINQLFNGLVQMDDDLNVIPSIASSWDISEDGIVYTFHLRTDVYFHDHELFPEGKGRKVVAEDFVHSLFRIVSPEVTSPGAWIFNNLDQSKDLGFKAPDDSTFQIYLKQPFPPFPYPASI